MSFETDLPEDAIFERRLLASAQSDASAVDARAAWARFAGRLETLCAGANGALAESQAREPAPAQAAAAAARPRVTSGAALRWLLVGAIGGSGLTAGLMAGRRHEAVLSPAPSGPSAHGAPGPATSGDEARPEPASARALLGHSGPGRRTVALPRSRSKHEAHDATGPDPERSTLAAEVSRIDTARTALSMGDYGGALQLVERYHLDFPDGVLAPDADVVGLEAAAAKRDDAEVDLRAQSFLRRYPNDPHAGRVRWLAERARTGNPESRP